MKKHYVYTHTRPDTGEIFYVGKGSGYYYRAYSYWKRNYLWWIVIKEIKGDYQVSIVYDNLTEQEALNKETILIKQYGRKDIKTGILCNLTDGGEGHSGVVYSAKEIQRRKDRCGPKHQLFGTHPTEETRRKQSLAKLGKPSNSKGAARSKEARDRISKALSGVPRPGRQGKHIKGKEIIDNNTGLIVANSSWGIYQKLDAEGLLSGRTYRTICNYLNGWKRAPSWFKYSYRKKPVRFRYDDTRRLNYRIVNIENGNIEYPCAREMSNKTGINITTLHSNLNGNARTNNFNYRYFKDFNKEIL